MLLSAIVLGYAAVCGAICSVPWGIELIVRHNVGLYISYVTTAIITMGSILWLIYGDYDCLINPPVIGWQDDGALVYKECGQDFRDNALLALLIFGPLGFSMIYSTLKLKRWTTGRYATARSL